MSKEYRLDDNQIRGLQHGLRTESHHNAALEHLIGRCDSIAWIQDGDPLSFDEHIDVALAAT